MSDADSFFGQPSDLDPGDLYNLLAENATMHRYTSMHYSATARLLSRLDWYRRRAKAWKLTAKAARATIPPNEAEGNVPAPATTGTTAAGVPQRTGVGPGPEGAPAAPALGDKPCEHGEEDPDDCEYCCVDIYVARVEAERDALKTHVDRLEAAQFVLKARIAELEAEKAAAVLAERERVNNWWRWAMETTERNEAEQRDAGIERGEEAPK